ncbi:CHAT domain-containing tetratricopeptide repeat protein [uncultured Aquimarina sp.]|uniref:CHAT domain-containing protein n=1 Tax=uncultured Aquimarina sp. TaxID=575652 RepID=UPI00262893DD|nr:CHAT domain-containing tetratricopeptide repeat protein [uncultured Aquimarina sp.]
MRKPYKRFPHFFVFTLFCCTVCRGQQISGTLDSIHNLNENDYSNIHLYDSLFDHYKIVKNYTQLGSDAHQLAKWLSREQKLDKTIEVLKTGIQARKKANPFNPELLKRSYLNLGNYYNVKKDYYGAIQAYKKMLNVKENITFNGVSYTRLGDLYHKLEDPHKAVNYFSKAFEFYDIEKDKSRIIKNHIEISLAYSSQKTAQSNDKALEHVLIADSLIKTQTKPSLKYLFEINLDLGVLYSNDFLNDHKKALFYYKKTLGYAKSINKNSHIGACYINIGIANLKLNNFKESEESFFTSLKFTENIKHLRAASYLGLAFLESKKENYTIAQEYYQKSLSDILNHSDTDTLWIPKAKDLQLSNEKEDILELFYFRIADYLKQVALDKNPEIYESILSTVKLGDSLINYITIENFSYGKKLLGRDAESVFNIMGLEACYQTNNLRDAFYLMEKSKAVLLMHDINDRITSLPTNLLSTKINYEDTIEKLQNEILIATNAEKDSLSSLIKKRKENFTHFKDSVSTEFPQYFSTKKIPEILKLSEIKVPKNKIIIQYMMAERNIGELPHAYVMVLTDNKQELFKIENIKELLADITELRELLDQPFKTSSNITAYRETANKIFKALFPKEIRASLKGKKITIIPDHVLGMIPFEALITDIDKNRYLIEDNEINYAFSLTFQEKNASIVRKADQDFLGIAPVNFTNQLTPLKNSTKEITYANDLYDGTLLLDQEATKENFIKEIKNYKILHLATHADASDSIAPWIAFRNSKLTDLELNSLQSQAELVVLSACNTSLGEISRGEGILSLARGFFKSGAHTVIPSLWSTNDKATATITSDFYKNLSEGQTKSTALRAAKLNYLNNNSDAEASPHYWASLVLIGDSGTLLPQANNLLFLWIGLGVLILLIGFFLFKKVR